MSTKVPLIDVRPDHWVEIERILLRFISSRTVVAFGSRANWSAKETSDLDLAIIGSTTIGISTFSEIENAFMESNLPYRVDIVEWCKLSSDFKNAIMSEYVVLMEFGNSKWQFDTIVTDKVDERVVGGLYKPLFPEGWKKRSLYSMATWTNGIAYKNVEFSQTGKPVIKIAELKDGISDQTKLTQQLFNKNVAIKSDDILFSWSGQPETSIDVFRWQGDEGWLNQHIFKVEPHNDVNKDFMYFLLKYLNPNFIAIARNKQTTGLGHVTKRDMNNILVGCPSLHVQMDIVDLLKPIENRIYQLKNMNERMEGLINAIFLDWFVRFGPTRTMLCGDKAYLSPAIWRCFPSRLDNKGVPVGWRTGKLEDIAQIKRSGVTPTNELKDTPYIGMEHMPKKSIVLGEWGYGSQVASQKMRFSRGDALFGRIAPHYHKVGFAQVSGVCSTDIMVISPREVMWQGYIVACMATKQFVGFATRTATGTTMPRANWKTLKGYKIYYPENELVEMYQDIYMAMAKTIINNIKEIKSLKSLLNLLIPKMFSGDISPIQTRSNQLYTQYQHRVLHNRLDGGEE